MPALVVNADDADIRRLPVRRAVHQLVEAARRFREALQGFRRHARLEAVRVGRLQQQRRDQRRHIGVAAALADAVERALNLAHAGAHRGQRVGDRLPRIVVRVDAEVVAGDFLRDLADDLLDFFRQRAAVGVAEHDPARARVIGRPRAGQRVFRVRLVAVEEMLAVEQNLAARRLRRLHRLRDRVEVLLLGRAERDLDLIVPGLGDETDRVGLGGEQQVQAGVVGNAARRRASPCRRR